MKKLLKKKSAHPLANSENESLDSVAYTEADPHAGQLKTGAQRKSRKMFTDGFKKLKDLPPNDDNPPRLYPGPDQPWNVSGSDKVASGGAGGFGPTGVPQSSARGANPTLKNMSSPKRVTPDLGPYGAPKGASGVTGVANTNPFQRSFGKFGHKPRQALKSITRLKRGM